MMLIPPPQASSARRQPYGALSSCQLEVFLTPETERGLFSSMRSKPLNAKLARPAINRRADDIVRSDCPCYESLTGNNCTCVTAGTTATVVSACDCVSCGLRQPSV